MVFSFKQTPLKILFTVVVVTLGAFVILLPAIRTIAINVNSASVYKNAQVDFQIPSPAEKQIVEIQAQPFVKNVFPYFDAFIALKTPGAALENFHVVLTEPSGADAFPFTRSSLRINGTGASAAEPFAFMDYEFYKTGKVRIGEYISVTIGTSVLSVPISATIANFNRFISVHNDSGGNLVLMISKSNLEKIAGQTLSYSGAYIAANDHSAAKKYLKDYKPFGRMKTRGDFSSDAAFERHVKEFNSNSYEMEITEFLPPEHASPLPAAMIFALVLVVIVVIMTVVPFSAKDVQFSIENRIKNGDSKIKGSIQRYTAGFVFLVSALLIAFFAFAVFTGKIYCPLWNYLPLIMVTVGVVLVGGLLFARVFADFTVGKYTKRALTKK